MYWIKAAIRHNQYVLVSDLYSFIQAAAQKNKLQQLLMMGFPQ